MKALITVLFLSVLSTIPAFAAAIPMKFVCKSVNTSKQNIFISGNYTGELRNAVLKLNGRRILTVNESVSPSFEKRGNSVYQSFPLSDPWRGGMFGSLEFEVGTDPYSANFPGVYRETTGSDWEPKEKQIKLNCAWSDRNWF